MFDTIEIKCIYEKRRIKLEEKEERRISIDIDKDLWHQVGIQSAINGVLKKEYVKQALEEKIERDRKGYEVI